MVKIYSDGCWKMSSEVSRMIEMLSAKYHTQPDFPIQMEGDLRHVIPDLAL